MVDLGDLVFLIFFCCGYFEKTLWLKQSIVASRCICSAHPLPICNHAGNVTMIFRCLCSPGSWSLNNNGNATVDTTDHGLDHVMHFVFDALKNTDRALTIKHQGKTYTIRGAPESDDYFKIGEILLGHNLGFVILGWTRQ